MEEIYNHENGDAAEEVYLGFSKTTTLLERETRNHLDNHPGSAEGSTTTVLRVSTATLITK
jgi:hypothetical protein